MTQGARSTIATGSRIGPYEVVGWLGAGGMGEVYRGRDAKLGRDVAIKILPELFALDPERLARFEREARMLAAVSHPHIAAIYGFEESSAIRALVLELVEGPTLADLLREPLPPPRALDIARQIAAALQAAHSRGIVHRDLKPANVKVADGDVVKVLDFGLAKVWAADLETSASQAATMTATGTREGLVIGTAAYMSPEQARGQAVDSRADIWAFGCVLYEMLAGCRAFSGDTTSEILAKVLEREPDWRALPSSTPARIRDLIRRCLQKDASRRLKDLGDAGRDIERCVASPFKGVRALASSLAWGLSRPTARVAIAIALAGAFGLVAYRLRDAPAPLPRLVNPLQVSSAIGVEDYPTLSPDARTVAYESNQAGNWDIWFAQVGGGGAVNRTADNPGDDRYPSWSPDGRQLAFWSTRQGTRGFYLMPALGGPAEKIAETRYAADFQLSPAEWSPDGTQLALVRLQPVGSRFAASLEIINLATHESRIIALPGAQEGRLDLSWSHDGQYMAYLDIAQQPAETSRVMVLHLADGVAAAVSDDALNIRSPRWAPDDRALLFVSNQASTWDLWRQNLDSTKRPRGAKERVTVGVDILHARLSADGKRLVYAKGRWVSNVWRVPIRNDKLVTWADAQQLTFDQAYIEFAQVSRDGQWLAFSSDRMGNQDLWKQRLDGGAPIRLTSDAALEWSPYWSPDGRQLAFYSNRSGSREIWIMSADGGVPRRLTSNPGTLNAGGPWSPDGTEIAYRSERLGSSDIWVTSVDGRHSRVLGQSPAAEYGHAWSPNGDWLAFISNRNGPHQLWRVPAAGGEPERLNDEDTASPLWSPDGKSIFYPTGAARAVRNLWALSVATKKERPVSEFSGRRGVLCFQPISTDGAYIYFTWREDLGDIWVMDIQ
jgi:Tol biopolymer transport system component